MPSIACFPHHDGDVDICGVDHNRDLYWFSNTGNGSSFDKIQLTDSEFISGVLQLVIQDIDADGDNDICVATSFEIFFFKVKDGCQVLLATIFVLCKMKIFY